MVGGSLHGVGAPLVMIHPVLGPGYARQQNLAPHQLLPENASLLRSSSLPAILGAQTHGEGSGPRNWKCLGVQELLWPHFFLDPALWWDSRRDDGTHRASKEVLWLKNLWRPAWEDDRPVVLGTLLGALSSSSNVFLPNGQSRTTGYEEGVNSEVVRKLCDRKQLSEAVDTLEVLVQSGSHVSTSLFYCVLKSCVAQKNLALGRRVHGLVVRVGYESDTFLATHILRMYAYHNMLQEAKEVFARVAKPDAFSWSAVIAAHAKHGEPMVAIDLYKRMRNSSFKPDGHVFVAALQACASTADLESGMQVHADVLGSGIQPNLFLWNCLVDMYAKCGRLEDARKIFDSLVIRDVVTWNTMIAGYTKCGRLEDARNMFDSLITRNVVTWNTIISGYADHGERGPEALSLYEQMEVEGKVLADPGTFASLLKACASSGALQQGMQLHSQISERGLEANIVVGTSLVDMYVKCGRLEDAQRVFESLPAKNVVTWTAIIAGHVENGLGEDALALYDRMYLEGLTSPNSFTFACLLKACAAVGALQQGKLLHSQILERGLDADTVVGTSLVDMYVQFGRLEDAHRVFDSLSARNVVTWNAIIGGYAEHGLGKEALALYESMKGEGSIVANSFTFACLVKACASIAALQQGKQLHAQILERGLTIDIVLGNCLVDMYAKCGRLEDAREVFNSMPRRDVVTWTMMIDGLGQSSEGHKAIECFEEMMRHGVQADETTYTCLLVACSHEGLVKEGQHLFKNMVEEQGIVPTTELNTCMVDLLGRAGYLDEAEKMLLSFENNDVGFMSLLTACKSHGDIERGRRCFERLLRSDSQNAGIYVIMGNIYAAAGRWSDVEMIERLRKSAGASKKPAVAGIEVDRHVHTFIVGKERGEISSKVRSMNLRLKEEGGHVPQTKLVLKRLSEKAKEDELCGHAEKLALAYGLLNTPDGTPLLVTKNLRMCGDCHSSTEIMSRIEKREIVVRDAHRIHRFVDGSCRCGGRT